ncbi:MAG: YggS family pyridoxal phosphate-dependent enzyme [Synergistaceae bacterium]|nr:YggS family pyridoxal phosphate-dependent enzyme [Synergistaceae bacterium]
MVASFISENIAEIRERISLSSKKSNRKPKDVKLMGVSKYHTLEMMVAASDFIDIIGENRVQDAQKKFSNWPRENETPWHLIGHLQRNKVRKAIKIFNLIESVDTLDLAEAIDRAAIEFAIPKYPIFIEINMSGEDTKIGIQPGKAEELLEGILEKCSRISIEGLMTIAPNVTNLSSIRKSFEGLRERRNLFRSRLGLELPELSMGMSGDYEIAIEEGSTIVRLGTAIFTQREN